MTGGLQWTVDKVLVEDTTPLVVVVVVVVVCRCKRMRSDGRKEYSRIWVGTKRKSGDQSLTSISCILPSRGHDLIG